MKNRSRLVITIAVLLPGLLALSLTYGDIQQVKTFPEDVEKVLKNSCFDCHSTASKNKDAKGTLNFETWNDYKLTKKISQMTSISEVLEEGTMPPEKYLGFKPDRALSDEQVKLVREWCSKETEKLMK